MKIAKINLINYLKRMKEDYSHGKIAFCIFYLCKILYNNV